LVDVPKRRRLLYQGRIEGIVAAEMDGRKGCIELVTLASSKVPS
jgi:hypothetical protein